MRISYTEYDMNSLGQITKAEADYSDKSSSPAIHRCQICTMIRKCYETGKHYCTAVEGEVRDMGGCKLFDIDLIKAATDPITIYTNPPEK